MLLLLLLMGDEDVHRAPVLTEDGRLLNYLTQTELLQFMAQSMYLLGYVIINNNK